MTVEQIAARLDLVGLRATAAALREGRIDAAKVCERLRASPRSMLLRDRLALAEEIERSTEVER